MEQYKPNLAQAMYGNPVSELACPNYIEAGLRLLAWYIETSEWNRTQEDYYPPTQNSGEDYKTNVFEMHAYYWGDDEALEERPNFKCGDFEVRWYKSGDRRKSLFRAN